MTTRITEQKTALLEAWWQADLEWRRAYDATKVALHERENAFRALMDWETQRAKEGR